MFKNVSITVANPQTSQFCAHQAVLSARRFSALGFVAAVFALSPAQAQTDAAKAPARLVPMAPGQLQQDPLIVLHNRPASDNAAIVADLLPKTNSLTPPFVFELSRRLLSTDQAAAFEWYAVASARSDFDGLRCQDPTAASGATYVRVIIGKEVGEAIPKHRAEYGAAGKRAIARADLFAPEVSPMWLCTHGASAVVQALQNKQAIGPDTIIKPRDQWGVLEQQVVARLTPYFAAQDQPQDDPVALSKQPLPAVQLGQRFGYFAWLDDQHLVAVQNPEPPPPGSPPAPRQSQLLSFDLSGQRRDVALVANFDHVCAGSGTLRYQTGFEPFADSLIEPGKGKALRVTFAVEKNGTTTTETVVLRPPIGSGGGPQGFSHSWSLRQDTARESPFDCHFDQILPGEPTVYSDWILLKEHDGTISILGNPPLATWNKTDGVTTPLNLAAPAIEAQSIINAEWMHGYVVTQSSSQSEMAKRAPLKCLDAKILHPADGSMEAVCVPLDPNNQSRAVMFTPSKLGWLRTASARETPINESFNGKFRDECLSMEWFRNRTEAKIVINDWRVHYNQVRPHSSLNYLTPYEFKAQLAENLLTGA